MSIRHNEPRFSAVERVVPLRAPVLGAQGVIAGPAVAARPAVVGVGALLTGQVLRDGEVVLLVLKPSRWYVVLSSLRWAAAVLIAAISLHLYNSRFTHIYIEAAAFMIWGRVMWATLQWMGRLYVLTDQRIVRISGVYTADIYECPLRRVARVRPIPTFRERLLRLGSIEIVPQDETRPCALWQTVNRPAEVIDEIQRAVRRARQGGCGW